MASILAMIPWYPAWIFGVFFGIWAWRVLRRPEVKAAFAHKLNPEAPMPEALLEQPHPPQARPRRGPFGKIKSLFGSVYSCFVTRRQSGPSVPTQPPGPVEDGARR
jgi:hypothetical protein